ncbi:uncharacterized protein LOC122927676 isoform X7 [Bufo gargarizans]|uniref:uncharacterized protein LOC122927676 isoform X7 n=1 Tax=Bufo gargarizans TaxID=30331 RepID=UPI001CF29C7E|nr:uncharacterized protein LOC122927676 isoform X7 [Bufo gargarizans]
MEETGKKWKKLEKNLSEPSKETFQKAELHNMKTRISFFSQCEFHILLIEGKQQVNESFQTITISETMVVKEANDIKSPVLNVLY